MEIDMILFRWSLDQHPFFLLILNHTNPPCIVILWCVLCVCLVKLSVQLTIAAMYTVHCTLYTGTAMRWIPHKLLPGNCITQINQRATTQHFSSFSFRSESLVIHRLTSVCLIFGVVKNIKYKTIPTANGLYPLNIMQKDS